MRYRPGFLTPTNSEVNVKLPALLLEYTSDRGNHPMRSMLTKDQP